MPKLNTMALGSRFASRRKPASILQDILVDTTHLLMLNIRALVDIKDVVIVTIRAEQNGNAIFLVKVHPDDIGKVIGKQGRNVGALRVLLGAIARQHGVNYLLEVEVLAGTDCTSLASTMAKSRPVEQVI